MRLQIMGDTEFNLYYILAYGMKIKKNLAGYILKYFCLEIPINGLILINLNITFIKINGDDIMANITSIKKTEPRQRLRGSLPKVGIRPVIDGRMQGVRESLEEQTMTMAKSAAWPKAAGA